MLKDKQTPYFYCVAIDYTWALKNLWTVRMILLKILYSEQLQ